MGICASCLGLRRRDSYDPENSRLLYNDDPYGNNYGTLHNTPNGVLQQDPHSAKREREALESITQRTQKLVFDVFASNPVAGGSSKMQSLLRNVWSLEDVKKSRPSLLNGDAYKSSPESSPIDDFGTVRRSRQGKLVSQIILD